MKLLITALLCLVAFNSNAVFRHSPTPQLHSILDKQALPTEKSFSF